MIKLSWAIHDIGRSAHGLYHAANREQKLQNMEALILGMAKAAAAASICLSLYTARFLIKQPGLQYALGGLTFCIHPLATLDALGTSLCIDGLFLIITAYIPHGKISAELRKMEQAAVEQVRAEGFKFYSFWAHLWGEKVPPETKRRLTEVFKAITDKYDFTQINAWAVPMAKDWAEGLTSMKYAAICGIGALFANSIPPFSWLDRKLIDLSRRLAPRLV